MDWMGANSRIRIGERGESMKQPMAVARYLITGLLGALLLSTLSACGFHLRGDVTLPPGMERTFIQASAPYTPLEADLRRALVSAGAEVVSTPGAAGMVLHVLKDQTGRRVLTVDETGKVSEYELIHSVEFELRDPKGQPRLPPQGITLTRDFTFDPTQVMGRASEDEVVREELRRDIVQAMLRRISVAAAAKPAAD